MLISDLATEGKCRHLLEPIGSRAAATRRTLTGTKTQESLGPNELANISSNLAHCHQCTGTPWVGHSYTPQEKIKAEETLNNRREKLVP